MLAGCWAAVVSAYAQGPVVRYGEKVSPEVDHIMERGLAWLQNNQQEDGCWEGDRGAAVTGLCVLAFLASGEDPNFGKYRLPVRRGLRRMILEQEADTGYLGQSMYHHGFGMLALAEAYGTVDDRFLWEGTEKPEERRSLGTALQLAVQLAVVSQQNNRWGGWRYNPKTNDADTSVSGAVLMGLLAARNAGIAVPESSIETALAYFKSSTGATGMVAYTGGLAGVGESMNRSAIATLVYAVGGKKDWREYKATLGHITARLEHQEIGHPQYFRYYMAQALFQGDFEGWERWNRELVRYLKQNQLPDGSFQGSRGVPYGTAMSLLALALNYRFLPIYER